MERFVINRNNPKTDPYALIGSDMTGACRYIKLSDKYENCIELTIPSNESLKLLSIGDIIVFRKISGTEVDKNDWGVYAESEVSIVDIEGNIVTVDIPDNGEVIHIVSTYEEGDDEGGKPGTAYLDGNAGFLPEDFYQYRAETSHIISATTTYKPDRAIISPVWFLSPVYRKFDTKGEESEIYSSNYDRSLINTYAYGTGDVHMSEYPFPIDFISGINKYFFESTNENDTLIYHMFDSTEVVKKMVYYEVKTPFYCQDEINLLQQNTITDLFSQEIKERVIPNTIDMEKFMFEPVMDKSGSELCNELVFNFHFRVRNDDKSWSINDSRAWNGITLNSTLTLDKASTSDSVNYLNFTDDDIKYQKMKVKKSFIRLSFYDTDNPLTQQLLYYSTIFLDSGSLFGDYVKSRSLDTVTTRITVKNKYNTDKSSEGFYLYLFNNEVEAGEGQKDIYMKVEFNHAGYGRTLPMLKPKTDDSGKIKSVNMKEYYAQQYIKFGVKSFKTGDVRHIYYVDENNKFGIVVDAENKRVIFNLFEVKLA